MCHAAEPPAGLVLTSAWPFPSTATHSETEAQDTPVRAVASILAALQLRAGAAPAGAAARQASSTAHSHAATAVAARMATRGFLGAGPRVRSKCTSTPNTGCGSRLRIGSEHCQKEWPALPGRIRLSATGRSRSGSGFEIDFHPCLSNVQPI